ncbi:hypothetical protein PN498_20980 [Oscillatoria sp. CS-180]|uniref:dCTP deaminase n=1 Tax=Oscillatoria sp. CS-180 TaxID=3021720 RepID=UPI00232F80C7|nr:hypothetical protein [Oscillatoria sp. CS-180]MDB9528479.1 hypothetical protein [Oscillatoria sp. CS-180]
MSVIPFIVDTPQKTIVESREEYENSGGLDSKVIFVEDLDKSQVIDKKLCNASYDLRVGDEYKDHRNATKHELLSNGRIALQPGSAVIIETAERFQFPKTRFGHIVPKVSLLQEGLSNTSSKVDPGYEGRLSITVFNLGKRTVTLEKGQKFCTLYILGMGGDTKAYKKGPKKISGSPRRTWIHKARDTIETNGSLISVIAILLSILALGVDIVRTIQEKRSMEANNIASVQADKELHHVSSQKI